jgi:hypothetical protein
VLILKGCSRKPSGPRQVNITLFAARKIDVEPDVPRGTSTLQVRSPATQEDLRSINSFTFEEVQPFILIHFRIGVYL